MAFYFVIDKPGAVVALVVKKTARSISIQWTLPSVTGGGSLILIIIRYTDASGQLQTTDWPINPRNATFPGLKPYQTYAYSITVKNEILESLPFNLKEQTLQAGKCSTLYQSYAYNL